MNGFEEMFSPQFQLHIFCHAIVDHQRAQQGGFRLNIVGQLNRGFGFVNQSDGIGHLPSMAHGYRIAKRQPRG